MWDTGEWPQNQLSSLLGQQQLQSYLGNSLAAYQQATLGPQAIVDYAAGLANVSPPSRNAWYHKEQAERAAERGEKLIERMGFWRGFGVGPLRPLAEHMISRLADRLEQEASEAESWLARG